MNHPHLSAVCFLFLGALLCAAPAPIFETEFKKNAQGQVIDNINAGAPGKITGSTMKFLPAELSGAVSFVGDPKDTIVFPFDQKQATPDEFTVTGWVKAEKLPLKTDPSPRRSFGVVCRGWHFYVILNFQGALQGNAQQLFALSTKPNQIQPGLWYHYAYTYSAKTKYYEFYLNGEMVYRRNQNWKKDQPFSKPFKNGMYFGSVMKYWPCIGTIGRTRLYDRVLTAEEITASEQDLVRKQLQNHKAGLPKTDKGRTAAENIDRLLGQQVIPIKAIRNTDLQP